MGYKNAMYCTVKHGYSNRVYNKFMLTAKWVSFSVKKYIYMYVQTIFKLIGHNKLHVHYSVLKVTLKLFSFVLGWNLRPKYGFGCSDLDLLVIKYSRENASFVG